MSGLVDTIHLPEHIIIYEVLPFLPLIDEAFIDVGREKIDRHKWMQKLKHVNPGAHNTVLTHGLQYYVDKRAANIPPETLIVVLMIGGTEEDLFDDILSDEVALLYVMLKQDHPTAIVNQCLAKYRIFVFQPFLTLTYLFTHGAVSNSKAILRILYPCALTPEYKLLITLLAYHPEMYGSGTTLLNCTMCDAIPLYSHLLYNDPTFAVTLIDAPGLDLTRRYLYDDVITTYLDDARTYLQGATDMTEPWVISLHTLIQRLSS